MAIEEVRAGSMAPGKTQILIDGQEFSIEIPDKEADAIHSGKCWSVASHREDDC